jgi:hypothetical protein
MHYKSLPSILILLLFLSPVAYGQKQINSPYARFNLGILEPSASVKSLGMGGIGVAMTSDNSIFFSNPASYSSIDTNSFVFDIGIDYGIIKLIDGQKHFTSDDMNFDHLIMGLPIAKGFGFAVGVVPFSNGYYKLTQSVLKTDPDYDPLVGEYTSIHKGDGGFNNLFLGTGLRITRNLSLGINMKLLFGQINRSYLVNFNDFSTAYNNNATEKLEMHGVNFDYGLHYKTFLKKGYFLTAGITGSAGKNYKTNYQLFSYKYSAYNTIDTLSYVVDDSTRTHLPGTYGIGLTFGRINKFTAGVDYLMTRWSGASIPGTGSFVTDSRSLRLGLEYIPEKYSNYSLLRRIEYRAGWHFGNTYLVLNNERIKEYGGSLGAGIPLRRTHSRANVYFDFTRRYGSGSGTGHKENIYTMGASLNFYDFWFIKKKYD